VQLDGRLGRAKRRPRKQRQAEVDRGGIERIDRFLEVHAEGLVQVEPARDADQVLCKLRIDAPIARLVRVGQRAACHHSPNTQVVELGRMRTKTGFDVAQALPISELCESHTAELVRTAEIANPVIPAVTLDDATEPLPRKMIHQLGEHQFANVHTCLLRLNRRQIHAFRRSNRRHPKNGSLLQPISALQNFSNALTGQQ
jgi:hypothetical protein